MIMTSHSLNFFLSGSLHFGIKFYCSDEDESSKLLFSSSGPTAVMFCRTPDVPYFDNDNDESQPKFFLSGSLHFGIKFFCCDEDESSKFCLLFERCFLLR